MTKNVIYLAHMLDLFGTFYTSQMIVNAREYKIFDIFANFTFILIQTHCVVLLLMKSNEFRFRFSKQKKTLIEMKIDCDC